MKTKFATFFWWLGVISILISFGDFFLMGIESFALGISISVVILLVGWMMSDWIECVEENK